MMKSFPSIPFLVAVFIFSVTSSLSSSSSSPSSSSSVSSSSLSSIALSSFSPLITPVSSSSSSSSSLTSSPFTMTSASSSSTPPLWSSSPHATSSSSSSSSFQNNNEDVKGLGVTSSLQKALNSGSSSSLPSSPSSSPTPSSPSSPSFVPMQPSTIATLSSSASQTSSLLTQKSPKPLSLSLPAPSSSSSSLLLSSSSSSSSSLSSGDLSKSSTDALLNLRQSGYKYNVSLSTSSSSTAKSSSSSSTTSSSSSPLWPASSSQKTKRHQKRTANHNYHHHHHQHQQHHHDTTATRLKCPPCDKVHCTPKRPSALRCPGSVVKGVCGCCPVCARQEGQSCGGPWNYLGTCDVHLRCYRLELETEEDDDYDYDDDDDDDDDYDDDDDDDDDDYVNDAGVFGYYDDDDINDDNDNDDDDDGEKGDGPKIQKLAHNGSITIHSIGHAVDHSPNPTVMATTKRVRHHYHYDPATPTAGATADLAAANRRNKGIFESATSDDPAVKVGNGRKPGHQRQTPGRFPRPVIMTTEDKDDEEEEGTCVKLSDVRGSHVPNIPPQQQLDGSYHRRRHHHHHHPRIPRNDDDDDGDAFGDEQDEAERVDDVLDSKSLRRRHQQHDHHHHHHLKNVSSVSGKRSAKIRSAKKEDGKKLVNSRKNAGNGQEIINNKNSNHKNNNHNHNHNKKKIKMTSKRHNNHHRHHQKLAERKQTTQTEKKRQKIPKNRNNNNNDDDSNKMNANNDNKVQTTNSGKKLNSSSAKVKDPNAPKGHFGSKRNKKEGGKRQTPSTQVREIEKRKSSSPRRRLHAVSNGNRKSKTPPLETKIDKNETETFRGCRPRCTFKYCHDNADAICSLGDRLPNSTISESDNEGCHAPCRHTSCASCTLIRDDKKTKDRCGSCRQDDRQCLKRFGACVKRISSCYKPYCPQLQVGRPSRTSSKKETSGSSDVTHPLGPFRFKCLLPRCP